MSGKSGHQEDDSNLQSFLRTTAVTYKPAYNRHAAITYICDSVSSLSGGT